MKISQCCRACMNDRDLNPIFGDSELQEQYITIFNLITGVVLDMNDQYPRVLCTKCVTFINKSIKFRKKCNESLKMFTKSLARGVTYNGNAYNINTNEKVKLINIGKYNRIETYNNLENDYNFDNDLKLEEFIEIENKTKVKKIQKVKSLPKPLTIECDICKKNVKRNRFKAHRQTHTGRRIICEHCAATFMSQVKFIQHCKSKHGYEKTDKCRYCEYKGSSAENVRIHERIHTGEKPYCCKDCGASFHRYSNYIQHIPIHLPEKTIKCDICSMMFKSVAFMKIHRSRIHSEMKYTYKCGVCKNTFARRYNVIKHLRKQHSYEECDVQKQVERYLKTDLLL